MRYLLDAAPLSGYLLGHRKPVALILPWIANKEAVTSNLVYAEVYEFIRDFPDFPARRVQLLSLILGPIPTLGLNLDIMARYADIRRYLRPQNQLIGDVDTLIAATALEHDLTVVTNNARHFQRVPGLRSIPY